MRMAAGVLVALLPVLLLTGCAEHGERQAKHYPPTQDYPITAAVGDVRLTVPVAADGTLSDDNRTRVVAFLDQWKSKGGAAGGVRLSIHGVSPAVAPLALTRVRSLAQPRGLTLVTEPPPADFASPNTASPGITLRGSRLMAVAPECPPETGASNDFNNQTSPAFGCSLQRSLAAMIDNPNDLITPRGASPADGSRIARVIDQYRLGKDTSAQTGTSNASIATSVGGKN